jgi:hypothetical protein
MSILATIGLVGKIVAPLLTTVFGIIDKIVPDKDEAARIKAEIQLTAMEMDHSEFETAIKEQSAIIQSETTGHSFLQRNWRPGLMCLFGLIIFNNYVLFPWLNAFWSAAPTMAIPPDMWTLLKIGVGGYVGGRTVEKLATNGQLPWQKK